MANNQVSDDDAKKLEIFKEVPAQYVTAFHRNSDADKDDKSLHHSLGNAPYQAARGNHTHDGRNSRPLFENVVISGSRGTSAGVASILDQLLTALSGVGMVNGTGP